ncbi:hypothetical protein ACR6C2_13945 [Streptomyces sp. INA 01156]
MADRGLHDPAAADDAVVDPDAWHLYRGTGRPREDTPGISLLPSPRRGGASPVGH